MKEKEKKKRRRRVVFLGEINLSGWREKRGEMDSDTGGQL